MLIRPDHGLFFAAPFLAVIAGLAAMWLLSLKGPNHD